MSRSQFHRNLWALTVLSFLSERSMHPYEMQRLMRERHKGELLDLKRGSLYHAIDRLEGAGMIEPVEVSREGRRPERTIYRLTEAGRDEFVEWLRQLLSVPTRDPNEFIAAVDHMLHLPLGEVADLLEMRSVHLRREVAGLEAVLDTVSARVGRLPLLEVDLARARTQAELDWVSRLVTDLRNGAYQADYEQLMQYVQAEHAALAASPSDKEVAE